VGVFVCVGLRAQKNCPQKIFSPENFYYIYRLMSQPKNYYKERYQNTESAGDQEFTNVNFLDQTRLQEQEAKIESGEISCNTDNPEECLNCGS
jgi:hypothetical protein